MAAATFTARQTAAIASKRCGRKVTDKAVRAYAREHLARLDDDRYTAHAYTSAERDRIVNGLVARSRPNATGTAGRAKAASTGRTPAKARPKAPAALKAPSSSPDGTVA